MDIKQTEQEGAYPPKTIDILGKTFNINVLGPKDNEDEDGSMHLATTTINFRCQPSHDYNADTIIHEITHAVDETLILGLTEEQVHLLTTGMMAVFKQNPDLVDWLFGVRQ